MAFSKVMAEETEMEPFVKFYCYGRILCCTTNPPEKSQQEKAKDLAGDGAALSWWGTVWGSIGATGKAVLCKIGAGTVLAKFGVTGIVLAKVGAVCSIAVVGGVACLVVGSATVAAGIGAYLLSEDPKKAEKAFLAECEKSHFSRGMTNASWEHVEKALKACIQLLEGLVKRSPDLLATTPQCIELISQPQVTQHARSICRYVVEKCVAACSEYENDKDENFRIAFRESRNKIKDYSTKLNSVQPSDGLGIARRRRESQCPEESA